MTGADLREWRRAAGLTQEELAARVGVSRMTVVAWERGANEPQRGNRAALHRLVEEVPIRPPPKPVIAADPIGEALLEVRAAMRKGPKKFSKGRHAFAGLVQECGALARALHFGDRRDLVRKAAARVAARAVQVMLHGERTFGDRTF